MLKFYSASTRIVNTQRAVTECMENALSESNASADLIIFHASMGHHFKEMMNQARALAPNATILAASCCGIVGKEGVSESMKDMAMMAISGKEFSMASSNDFKASNAYQESLEMAKKIKAQKPETNMVYYLGTGIDTDNDAVIKACEDVFGKDVTVFGATSSDNMKGVTNFQAVNSEIYEHGAFMVGFADPGLRIATQATHGFLAVGEPMTVTRSEGNIIYELNGKPAWTEYTQRLGLTPEADCGQTIPVGALAEKLSSEEAAAYGNEHILRVVTSRHQDEMHYATAIAEGTKLWITIRDEDLIFSELNKMTAQLKSEVGGHRVEAIFHADCLARGKFLFNKIIKEELVNWMQFPFLENGLCPPWLGMYGFGEFARLHGKNYYHNYTTALYVIYRVN